MSVVPHKLTPETKNSFWVNLIGHGYPAPRKLFRWCTVRLKIEPSNRFIRDVVRENGEAILVLGTRKAESQRRALAKGTGYRAQGTGWWSLGMYQGASDGGECPRVVDTSTPSCGTSRFRKRA